MASTWLKIGVIFMVLSCVYVLAGNMTMLLPHLSLSLSIGRRPLLKASPNLLCISTYVFLLLFVLFTVCFVPMGLRRLFQYKTHCDKTFRMPHLQFLFRAGTVVVALPIRPPMLPFLPLLGEIESIYVSKYLTARSERLIKYHMYISFVKQ